MKYFLILIITVLFVACEHKQNVSEKTSVQKSYFDLGKLVRIDIENNAKNNCGEEKTVIINGKTESKKNDTIDWEKELQLLSECDINKPSWKGKFDAQVLNDSLKYIYTANSSKIPIRQIIVNYEQKNGKIISVEIEKKTGTVLFSNEQHISYYPEKSFKINAHQKAIFMNDFNSEVEIKYLCKD